MKHGYGKEYFDNGDIYEGEYLMDQMHGKGKYIYKDGGYYIGEFHYGSISG